MEFIDSGNEKVIRFDKDDTDTEKRMVEQALAFLRNLLARIRETTEAR